MAMQAYEVILAREETIQRIRDAQRAIERLGGAVEIGAPTPTGVRLARIILPEPMAPDDVLPGIPFVPA
jgi:hypothetical protein